MGQNSASGYGCTKGSGGGAYVYPVQGHTVPGGWGPKSSPVPVGCRFTALNPQIGAQNALKWPKITQNGSGRPPDRVQRGYPLSPPDSYQLPTKNRQPPSAINRQPSPTSNRHQLPTDNQARWVKKQSKIETFKSGSRHLKMVKPTNGATYNCQPPSTTNRHQPPTDNQTRWAQKRSETKFFNSGPRHLGMDFLGHFGPALTRFQLFSAGLACYSPVSPGS